MVAEVLAEEAKREQSELAKGPTATIGLFGTAGVPGRHFVFALDRSKSMGGDGLNVLKRAELEVAAAVGRLESNHRFQVVVYNEENVMLGRRGWMEPTAENQKTLADFFAGLASHGGTNHYGALLSALRLSPDVVFLVSDGADPKLTETQQRRIVDMAGSQTRVICLLFGRGKLADPAAAQSLKAVAEATGGTCHVFDTAE